MPDIQQQIKNSINALRTRLTPSSITPSDVADLLQAIFDFVQALSLAPQSEILNLNQQITAALNAANSAMSAAESANTNASNQHITVFEQVQGTSDIKISLKQSGSAQIQIALPLATALKAGLLSKEMYNKINDTKDKIDNKEVDNVEIVRTSTAIQIKIVKHDHTFEAEDILGATSEYAGLMTAHDKQALDALPAPQEIAKVEASGALKNIHAPHVVLRKLTSDPPDETYSPGDNYFEDGNIFHVTATTPINLGAPSKELVYIHHDTGALYRWNGASFSPVVLDPSAGLEKRAVRTSGSKRYDIPAGVLANVKPTTDVVNVNLLAGQTGRTSVHRILLEAADFQSVTTINWPNTLHWDENGSPDIQHVTSQYGLIVEIIDGVWASYRRF